MGQSRKDIDQDRDGGVAPVVGALQKVYRQFYRGLLTKDVIRYQSVIDGWKIPELSEQFQILREIGNLFTVQTDLVNSLVTEGQLANMKPYTVRQYITKEQISIRADKFSSSKNI